MRSQNTRSAGPLPRSLISGFSLVEVLAALIVLSVGMLGLAALGIAGVRTTRAAIFHTQAVTLAADMADRMRANREPAAAYDCSGSCEAGAGGNDVAIADLASWSAMVAAGLPDGDGAVSHASGSPGAPDRYTVSVSWTEPGTGGAAVFELAVVM